MESIHSAISYFSGKCRTLDLTHSLIKRTTEPAFFPYADSIISFCLSPNLPSPVRTPAPRCTPPSRPPPSPIFSRQFYPNFFLEIVVALKSEPITSIWLQKFFLATLNKGDAADDQKNVIKKRILSSLKNLL